MTDLEQKIQHNLAESRITIDDADEIRNFASFLEQAPSPEERKTPEGRRRFRKAYREHYPEEYARAVAEEHARRSSLHDVRHGATIMSTGHHGCWFVCLCGVKGDPRWRTEVGASIDWAAHLAEATR